MKSADSALSTPTTTRLGLLGLAAELVRSASGRSRVTRQVEARGVASSTALLMMNLIHYSAALSALSAPISVSPSRHRGTVLSLEGLSRPLLSLERARPSRH